MKLNSLLNLIALRKFSSAKLLLHPIIFNCLLSNKKLYLLSCLKILFWKICKLMFQHTNILKDQREKYIEFMAKWGKVKHFLGNARKICWIFCASSFLSQNQFKFSFLNFFSWLFQLTYLFLLFCSCFDLKTGKKNYVRTEKQEN